MISNFLVNFWPSLEARPGLNYRLEIWLNYIYC